MKTIYKKLALFPSLIFILAACGQLKNSEKANLAESTSSKQFLTVLSSEEFKNQCNQKGGYFPPQTPDICIYSILYKTFSSGTSTTTTNTLLTTVPEGGAILFYMSNSNVLQLFINNVQIMPNTYSQAVMSASGGELRMVTLQGYYPSGQIAVYSCRDKYWQNVKCPFKAL